MGLRLRRLPAEWDGIQPPTLCGLWIVLSVAEGQEGFDVDVTATLGNGMFLLLNKSRPHGRGDLLNT